MLVSFLCEDDGTRYSMDKVIQMALSARELQSRVVKSRNETAF